MGKVKNKTKKLKKLNDQLKGHSQNLKMVENLKGRIATVESQK